MRYTVTADEQIGELSVELTSTSYSDSFPMLRRLTFRKLPLDINVQALPLACAILTRSYCGDHFEVTGCRIGSDYAEAIRTVLGGQTNVANVDGLNRTLSTGEVDVVSSRTGVALGGQLSSRAPLVSVNWSGDFVDTAKRSSAGFQYGSVQTNAQYFADAFSVSVAVGILAGRDRCGTLHVPGPTDLPTDHRAVAEALRIAGIQLATAKLAA